jgi:hypothetical protein
MSTILKLDTAALQVLFPEGSEARVELQRACIVNLVANLAIKDIKLLDESMKAHAEVLVTNSLASLGIAKSWRGEFELRGHIGQKIQLEVAEKVNELVRQDVRDEVSRVKADLDVKERVTAAVSAVIDAGVNDAIKKLVREALASSFKV